MINLSEYKSHNELKELRATEKKAIEEKKLKSNVLQTYKFLVGKSLAPKNLGACTYKVANIAEKLNISLATATRCIKSLKDMELIQVVNKTKGNGIKGANVYRILPFEKIEVFNEVSDDVNLSYRDECETPTASKVEDDKKNEESLSFNLLNKSFKTSTLNNIYLYAYQHEEFLNQYQKSLYELMNSVGVDKIIGDELGKVIAATEINSVEEFHVAKEIIMNIALDLQSGRLNVDTTLRAIYKGAYNKKMTRSKPEKVKAPVELSQERTVPFYNWLDEREVVN